MVTQKEPGDYQQPSTPCCKSTSPEHQWTLSQSPFDHGGQDLEGRKCLKPNCSKSEKYYVQNWVCKAEYTFFLWHIRSTSLLLFWANLTAPWAVNEEPWRLSLKRGPLENSRNGKFILLGAWISVGWGTVQRGCRSTPVHHRSAITSFHFSPNSFEYFPYFKFKSLILYFISLFLAPCENRPSSFSLALLSLLGETLGTQRIVLQLSFPEYFSLYFSCMEPRRVFYPLLQYDNEEREEQDGSSHSGCCHSN